MAERYPAGSKQAALASEETDALLKQFLLYPNPYRFVIVTDSYMSGKLRGSEMFLSFKDRDVVRQRRDAIGIVHYGNDYPASDEDLRAEDSWGRRRYSHLFSFTPFAAKVLPKPDQQ